MSNPRVALANITNKIPDTYNTNEGWIIKKMRLEYANRIAAILPIIYQKNKVHYFNNKSIMMISITNHGEFCQLGYNYVFSIGQGDDHMGKVSKKHEQPKENPKRMCVILP
jgi:hypothetical protein